MNNITADAVYETLINDLNGPYQVPGVENAFTEDSPCSSLYREVYQANLRLCERLGQPEADPDVELIINNLLAISKKLCIKMYHYGQNFPHATDR